jgi:hypothetical protein
MALLGAALTANFDRFNLYVLSQQARGQKFANRMETIACMLLLPSAVPCCRLLKARRQHTVALRLLYCLAVREGPDVSTSSGSISETRKEPPEVALKMAATSDCLLAVRQARPGQKLNSCCLQVSGTRWYLSPSTSTSTTT